MIGDAPERSSASWLRVARGIWRLLDPSLRRRFKWLSTLMIVVAAFEMFVVAALAAFVASIGNVGYFMSQPAGRLLAYVAPQLTSPLDERRIVFLLGGVMVLLVCLKNGVRGVTDRTAAWFCSDLDAYFGGIGMERIMQMPYQKMKTYKIADLSRYIDWRTFLGSDFARSYLLVMQNAIIMFVVFGSLLVVYPWLSAMMFLGAGGTALIIYRVLRPRIDRELNAYLQNVLEVGRQTLSCLCGMREIKLFGTEARTLDVFRAFLAGVARARANGLFAARLPSYLLDAAGTSLLVLVVIAMIFVGTVNSSVTSTAAVFAIVAMRMISAVNSGLAEIASMRAVVPFAEQLLATLMQPQPPGQADAFDDAADPRRMSFDSAVELRNVSFRYEDGEGLALEEVTVRLQRGTLVGLVGSSGAGKSTFVDLVSGLLVPCSGEVRVDGVPLDASNRRLWMRSIGYVAQSPFFFGGTLAQNIAFENDARVVDRARVLECCRLASIDFLDEQQGIDMPLVEGGSNFSIGQRQRIAIARALYRKAPLVVFDEPTSALDPYNEQRIQDLIKGMRGKETVIVIAHRLSTVEACDRILWLDGGRVLRDGPASEVLEAYLAHIREKAREGQEDDERERRQALSA